MQKHNIFKFQNLYDEFHKGVELDSEVFEPNIQNIKELVTSEINRVHSRIQKDNASIILDNTSLKFSEVSKVLKPKNVILIGFISLPQKQCLIKYFTYVLKD